MANGVKQRRLLQSGVVILAMGLVTGCVAVPKSTLDNADNAPDVQVDWSSLNNVSATAKPAKWWSLFDDPVLSSLEDRAQQSNLDLKLVSIRWQESRAQLGLVSSAKGVQWSVDGGFDRSAYSQDNPLVKLGGPTTKIDTWKLSTGASWEMDLWGYLSFKEQAAQQKLRSTALENAMVQVSLSADVARNYWRLRGLQTHKHYLQQQIAIAEERFALAQSRERNGVGTHYQTLATSASVADIKAKLPTLEHQIDSLKSALSLLLGLSPHSLDQELGTVNKMPSVPVSLPIGVPSELAKNRPDILMAAAKLKESIAQVGAAHADFYPRVRLSASVGVLSNELSNLGDWDSRQYSVGPSFHLPLFQGGRLRQMLALSEAKQKEAAVAYRKTVLSAWHEIEDSLSAWTAENQQVQRLVVAKQQRIMALQAAINAYKQGAADRSDVLNAKQALLMAEQAVLDGKVGETLSMVALYRSLGGSWSADLSTAADSAAKPNLVMQ